MVHSWRRRPGSVRVEGCGAGGDDDEEKEEVLLQGGWVYPSPLYGLLQVVPLV